MAETWKHNNHTSGDIWKGAAAGIAGGLVASWVMNQFQQLAGKLGGQTHQESDTQSSQQQERQEQQSGSEDSTVKTAERVSRALLHRELSKDAKKKAGPAVHYAMGAVAGGIYGAAAELAPVVATGAGLPFGTAVWLAADEVAVPALKLSKSPKEYPPKVHAQALGAHLVYGLTTDLVRRGLRRVF